MARPLLSVLVDTYNHEKFIEQAIVSVLEQDFPIQDVEILVVDDGSTDRTPEILKKFEPRIRNLRKNNGGQASAFNLGIPECRGEIVAFLDGDDWWVPNKLTLLSEAFQANPGVGLIGSSITEVLADGGERSELVRDSPRFRIESLAGARTFRMRKSFLGTSRMAYRAELLRRIGPVPEALVIEADEFLFTLGSLFSEVLIVREPLTFYRLHGQNLFQISDGNKDAKRRKYNVICALHESLRQRLAAERVPPDIADCVLESVQSEADVLRVSLDGGSRLETVRVELRNYRIMHENASRLRWLLKCASLFPALFLAPEQYAALRRKVASNAMYRRFRTRFAPSLKPTHVERTGQWSAR
jgi:cellulose synthase/poly-beta-1,6-N-acetylglucosamine synthase-like glycosyltransferase